MSPSPDIAPMPESQEAPSMEGVASAAPQARSDAEPTVAAPVGDSMQEFYRLQRMLFRLTLAVTAIVFCSVWVAYSLSVAASYLLGASAGMFYLSRLAKDVSGMGASGFQLGSGRIAVFIGLVVVATQLQSLQILPTILGFLTYKIAILIYAVQTAVLPE